jgi:hypothetical protein
MAVNAKSSVSRVVQLKARHLLKFVQENAPECKGPAELFIVVFGPRGKATRMFATDKDWAAFERTAESKKIRKLLEALPVKSAK